MKKLCTLVCCCLLLSNFSQAQTPILTDAGNLEPGNSMNIHTVDIADGETLNQGPSGADIIWDFSDVAVGTSQAASTLVPGQTPHGDEFPDADVAVYFQNEGGLQTSSASVAYMYYSTENSFISTDGIANTVGVVINYSDPKEHLLYPFTYGSATGPDDFSAVFDVSGTAVSEIGTVSASADGYGTLLLPEGLSYEGVLRLRITENYEQSADGFVFATIQTETYAWYHPCFSFPLLTVSTEVVNPGSVNPVTGQYAFFTQVEGSIAACMSVGISDAGDFSLSTYPNPIVNIANINYQIDRYSDVQLNVFNSVGQLVYNKQNAAQTAGNHSTQIDFNNYSTGMYIIELIVNDQRDIHKVIKQ